MAENVVTFEEAREIVLAHARPAGHAAGENVPLASALGRVLAENIVADRDYPPFDRATRDGYAVRASDLAAVPARLKNIGQIMAGDEFKGRICAQQCVEIMTGAAVPAGADAVVMVEFTRADQRTIAIERSVMPGENIVPRGAECRHGELLLHRGRRIRTPEISVAATVGCRTLKVFAKPRVAILSTGDEVVEIERVPGPVQIRNSNAHSLAAHVRAAGGEPIILPIAPDEAIRLRELIEQGLQSDLLLLSGGVSMGKHDLVEGVLSTMGAELFFTGVKIQPGKPLVFGKVRDKYFFGLPGNPVSTMVTFELFARTILDALAGATPAPLRFVQARLENEFTTKTGLTRFLPARVSAHIAGSMVTPVAWKGSGDVFAQSRADCLLVVPPDRERIAAGETVTILPL